jgi:hypothetical protein
MLGIPVNKKRIIVKLEGQGGGEAQGVADPPPQKKSGSVRKWNATNIKNAVVDT